MTPSPSMLPVSGEQHEKAREAGATALATTGVWRTDSEEAEATIAAYFEALAAQGVRLVDVREVAEWLRGEADRLAGTGQLGDAAAAGAALAHRQAFLRRFGGGDERSGTRAIAARQAASCIAAVTLSKPRRCIARRSAACGGACRAAMPRAKT